MVLIAPLMRSHVGLLANLSTLMDSGEKLASPSAKCDVLIYGLTEYTLVDFKNEYHSVSREKLCYDSITNERIYLKLYEERSEAGYTKADCIVLRKTNAHAPVVPRGSVEVTRKHKSLHVRQFSREKLHRLIPREKVFGCQYI